jgi:DNA-binding transcriptional LysR family regulator
MDLRELRYFVALAEERHFGRAAERLYIAQSGLSKAIRRAEDELGVALFERTHRNVALTAAGQALLERAYDVLGAFEEVRATAEAARVGMAGVLLLASSPVARYNLAAPILERFAETCPQVRVLRREQLAAEIHEELLAGTLEVGIAFCMPPHVGLRYEPLLDVELRALLASSHPLAARGTVTLSELRSERFLVPAAEGPTGGSARRLAPFFGAAGFEPEYVPSAVAYDEDLHGVHRGEGVVLSTRTFLGDPPSGITALNLEPSATLPLGIVRRAAEAPSAILIRFIELAREVAKAQGWRTVQG